jgi:3-hydroxyisobutyrate dehydrogenase-like beta-hydroxyacid dehydrogenase
MELRTIGLLSPGDMGHTIGAVLRKNGLRVVTSLEGRSARTRALAEEAGLEDAGSVAGVVAQSDAILCVLVPAVSREVAEQVAAGMRSSGRSVLYADLNAIAPRTAREVAATIEAAGGTCVDGGIIGPPPSKPGTTRIYVSGEHAETLLALNDHGLDLRLAGSEIGQASGLKMCYGALTKGLQALGVELLVAARAMGLDEKLRAEQEGSLADIRRYLEGSVPRMPPKAYRWVGEMEEIAQCFADVGMTPKILEGAADIYRFVGETPLGRETPESRQRGSDLDSVIAELSDALQTPAARG